MIYICIFICIELFLSIVVSFSSSVLRHNVLVLACCLPQFCVYELKSASYITLLFAISVELC